MAISYFKTIDTFAFFRDSTTPHQMYLSVYNLSTYTPSFLKDDSTLAAINKAGIQILDNAYITVDDAMTLVPNGTTKNRLDKAELLAYESAGLQRVRGVSKT